MCIGVGASDGGQRRERPLDGDRVGDDLQCLGVRSEGIGPAGDLVQVRPDPRQLAGALSLRLAGADLHPHVASSAHDVPLPLGGSEGAQPLVSPFGDPRSVAPKGSLAHDR